MLERRFSPSVRGTENNRPDRVIEPELDMERKAARPASLLQRVLKQALQWLVPHSGEMKPPARSTDRELAEAWPSRDYY